MQAVFYNFTKRAKSTLRPTQGQAMDIVFKYPTNTESPTLQIKSESFNFNYCYIRELSTYYRITSRISIAQGIWEISLEHDLLSTFRDEIIGNNAYIEYASKNFDPLRLDSRCAMHTPRVKFSSGVRIPYMSNRGSYALTVLSKDENASRFTTTYLIDEANLKTLVNELLDTSISWGDILKIVNNPIESIIRLAWIPFRFPDDTYIASTVKIGTRNTNARGLKLSPNSNNLVDGEILLLIPWEYDDFRRYEPYSKLSIWIPMYGSLSIPTSNFIDADNIVIRHSVDLFTGEITLAFGEESGDYRQTISYNSSVEIPVAQLFTNVEALLNDVTSVTSGVLSTIGAAMSKNPIGIAGGIAHTGVSAINLALDSQSPTKSYKGSQQGLSLSRYPLDIILTLTFYDTENPAAYTDYKGRPIFAYDSLSNYLGGFVQGNASLTINNALPQEVERLENLLSEGIYLE